MFSFATQAHVDGLSSHTAFEFLLHAGDADFQAWWPGTHHRCVVLRRAPNHIGSRVRFEQSIGPYRVRETAQIVEVVPHKRIVRQVIVGVPLPIFIAFDFVGSETGTTITHTIDAGFRGLGAVLDPLHRLFFTRRFIAALDEHLKIEFELLREVAPRFVESRRE